MATDVERLVVSLEASITKYERAMQRARGQTNQTAKRIEDRFAKTNQALSRRFDQIGAGMSMGLAKAFAGAAALRGASQLMDASTRVTNSLKVAGLAGEDLTDVYDSLFASAQRNAVPLEDMATLYARASLSAKDLGATQDELKTFVDNVGLSLRVGGKSAQEASGALLQLSQVLGNGTVQAEEYNSLLDGAQPLLQAVAAGMEETGGSVSALTRLVKDGKVSSAAFFRAFEAGSVILQEKVAGAELTVSQSFVRLQNVLIDAAGRFDAATGASADFARFLDGVGQAIDRLGNNERMGKILQFMNDFGDAQFDATAREFEVIGGAIEGAIQHIEGIGYKAIDASGRLATLEASAANVLAQMLGFDSIDMVSPEQRAQIEAFIADLGNTGASSDDLMQKLRALGGLNVNFAIVTSLQGLRAELIATRGEAVATAAAIAAAANGQTSSTNINDQRAEQRVVRATAPKPPTAAVAPVSLANYPVIGSGGSGGSSGSSGGSKQSPEDRFGEAMADQQRRIDELQRETKLRRELGLVVDENGFAMERLRVQLDLENEASRAGLELTPARAAAIDELASSYARASVEAEQLKQSQELAADAMQSFADAAQSGLRGFIDDLIEGKSATEALGNALASIGSSLLDFGLDSLMGFFKPGSGGLAAMFPGRAAGGPVTAGQPYIVGEKRPELFIPNQSGRIIPRIPTMPNATAAGVGGGGGQLAVDVQVTVDQTGNLVPIVTRVAGQVAGQQIKQNNKQLPGLMRDITQRTG